MSRTSASAAISYSAMRTAPRAHPHVTRRVESLLVELGYSVRRNDPYAGGYITRHYGRPREGVHALQIEIARDLYMDEGRIERCRFATVQTEHHPAYCRAGERTGRALAPD